MKEKIGNMEEKLKLEKMEILELKKADNKKTQWMSL